MEGNSGHCRSRRSQPFRHGPHPLDDAAPGHAPAAGGDGGRPGAGERRCARSRRLGGAAGAGAVSLPPLPVWWRSAATPSAPIPRTGRRGWRNRPASTAGASPTCRTPSRAWPAPSAPPAPPTSSFLMPPTAWPTAASSTAAAPATPCPSMAATCGPPSPPCVLAGLPAAAEQTAAIGCNIKWHPGREPEWAGPVPVS